jgi:hypothetical protein
MIYEIILDRVTIASQILSFPVVYCQAIFCVSNRLLNYQENYMIQRRLFCTQQLQPLENLFDFNVNF